jgi:hypothetical protein
MTTMSRTTEIYICQPGQDIKQGKLETNDTITTGGAAMSDAAMRTKADPSVAMIAYYSVGEDGDVQDLFTYEGSKTSERPKQPAAARGKAGIAKDSKKKAVRKTSFFGRLRSVFEA